MVSDSLRRYPELQAALALPDETSRSLVDQAADEILRRIILGKLAPGKRLTCTQLATQLGMSRTPVAGGLAKLVHDGVLQQTFNHAATVGAEAHNWLDQVHSLRQLIEPEAAALAAGRLPAEIAEDLRQLTLDAKPTRSSEWASAAQVFDFALHLAIAEFCGNKPLATAIRKCWSYKRLSYSLSDECRANLKPEYLEHVAILDALTRGKARQAKTLMGRHLQTASLTRAASGVV